MFTLSFLAHSVRFFVISGGTVRDRERTGSMTVREEVRVGVIGGGDASREYADVSI